MGFMGREHVCSLKIQCILVQQRHAKALQFPQHCRRWGPAFLFRLCRLHKPTANNTTRQSTMLSSRLVLVTEKQWLGHNQHEKDRLAMSRYIPKMHTHVQMDSVYAIKMCVCVCVYRFSFDFSVHSRLCAVTVIITTTSFTLEVIFLCLVSSYFIN